MNETISIIIPVYNVELYLDECIESMRKQTYHNIEILLIDDGSTDSSPQICDSYALKDSRVKVVHQRNQGPSVARNTGLENAIGEYIVFIDSDDFINEKMIEKLYTSLKETNSDMSICNFKYIYESCDDIQVERSPIKDEILYTEDIISKLFQSKNWYYVVVWNKMYKRELWEQIRYPVGYIYEDEMVAHHIFANCKKVASISEELYFYRQISGSIMHRGFNESSLDKYSAYADRLIFLKKRISEDQVEIIAYQYWCNYLEDYFYFRKINKKSAYLKRMKKSLILVFPILIKYKFFTFKDAIGICIFLVLPEIYKKLFYKGDKGLNGTDMDNSDSAQE